MSHRLAFRSLSRFASTRRHALATSRFRSSLAPTYYYDDLAYLVKQGCITQGRITPLYNARGARRFVARQLLPGTVAQTYLLWTYPEWVQATR